jgi:catalase (peroxidase I)
MPNKWAEPETAAKWAKQKEYLQAAREAKAAAEEQKRMEDELGLIYIDPGTNPFPTEPPRDSKKK